MQVFLVLAVLGFFASLVVHFSTFTSHPIAMERSWPLHFGIFIVFIPAALIQRRSRRDAKDATAAAAATPRPGRAGWREHFPHAPAWMHAALTVFFVYALVNFALFIYRDARTGGRPEIRDGKYYL